MSRSRKFTDNSCRVYRLSNNDSQVIGYLALPMVRGCCRFSGFTTTAYPLRVQGGGNDVAMF